MLATGLSVVYRALVQSGSFPVGWRKANIIPIPKRPSSADPALYRPISRTPVRSKVFGRLLVGKFSVSLERSDALPARQYAYRRGLECYDALLEIFQQAQTALEKSSELRLIQPNFSATIDRVSREGLLYKMQSIGVSGVVLSIIREFLSGSSQVVVADGSSSASVDVESGIVQRSVLGSL